MFGKKKKTLGFQPKPPKTKEQIEREYGDHALQVGHKTRMIKEFQIEIDHHTQQMMQLNREGTAIAKEEEKAKIEAVSAAVKAQNPPAESA